MIGSITVEAAGKSKTLKFSTRAQARVERSLGVSVAAVMEGFSTQRYGVDALCEILAAAWNDGRGADVNIAYDFVDSDGQERAFEVVGDLITAAFPDPEDKIDNEGEPGKPKG